MTQTDDRSTGRSSNRTSKKTTGKTAKKTARKTTDRSSDESSEQPTRKRAAPRAEPARRPSGRQVAAEAARQLVELTGKEPEGIVGLERTEDGWTVEVEVLELRRVPSTTDVLATYAVAMDDRGELEGYQRRARYVRGAAGED